MNRHLAPALGLCTAYALFAFWPLADSLVGWGGDPWFNLWTFEIVWHRIAQHGPFWFLHAVAWRAPIYAGSALGLACSENQAWPALLLWPSRVLSQNGSWTLQAGAVLMTLAAFACATRWLRSIGIGSLAPWGGLLAACSGWLQSQRGHYQNLCLFVIPLALWAFNALRARPGRIRAALAGAAFGWMAGWNVYYLLFSTAALGWLWFKSLRRRELRLRELLPFTAAAALLAAPFAIRYVELEHTIGTFHAFASYGTTLGDLLARSHAPRLLPPRIEATSEAGGLGLAWFAVCALALRVPWARPWLLAAAIACWVALGPALGAWQLLGSLPVINGMRAIGRAECLVVLFSIPAILFCLQSLKPATAATLLFLILVELIPGAPPERVPVDRAWFGPTPLSAALAGPDPVLVLPAVDQRLMVALANDEAPYFGGFSGRAPPGEESLAGAVAAGLSVREAAVATGARRLFARTPRFAQETAALPGSVLLATFDEGALFALPESAPPLLLDRDTIAEHRDGPWPTLELRAQRAGALSVRNLDRCRLYEELRLGPLSFAHALRLQGNELRTLTPRAGELIVHHEARLAIFRLPPALRPQDRLQIACRPGD